MHTHTHMYKLNLKYYLLILSLNIFFFKCKAFHAWITFRILDFIVDSWTPLYILFNSNSNFGYWLDCQSLTSP